ncbi:MAG: hypothetical protein VXY47_00610 [Bacteroidota bacterium]|nr:hypothetical protein [Bacteroidota bacterium]
MESPANNREVCTGEAADLLFHLLVLLRAKNIGLNQIEEILKARQN